ncbi:hypothetical protein HOL46_02460 [Candidatus Falkowbacteria bacterium]|nr:hypothetical protein [Candidatus Falkowbacteria bacterium]
MWQSFILCTILVCVYFASAIHSSVESNFNEPSWLRTVGNVLGNIFVLLLGVVGIAMMSYINLEVFNYREKVIQLVYAGDLFEYYIDNGAQIVRKFSYSPEVLWIWNSGMSLLLMGVIKVISLLVKFFDPLPLKGY